MGGRHRLRAVAPMEDDVDSDEESLQSYEGPPGRLEEEAEEQTTPSRDDSRQSFESWAGLMCSQCGKSAPAGQIQDYGQQQKRAMCKACHGKLVSEAWATPWPSDDSTRLFVSDRVVSEMPSEAHGSSEDFHAIVTNAPLAPDIPQAERAAGGKPAKKGMFRWPFQWPRRGSS